MADLNFADLEGLFFLSSSLDGLIILFVYFSKIASFV